MASRTFYFLHRPARPALTGTRQFREIPTGTNDKPAKQCEKHLYVFGSNGVPCLVGHTFPHSRSSIAEILPFINFQGELNPRPGATELNSEPLVIAKRIEHGHIKR